MNIFDTENAKALHKHRKAMYESADEYRKSFIDAVTGLIDEKYTEFRVCPVCHSSSYRVIFKKNGGQYVICQDCSMVFLNPSFKDYELSEYYKNNNTMQASAHESESVFYRKIYNAGLRQILNHRSIGDLIDIGCSGGFFLDIARDNGFVTYGIELNKSECAIAQEKKHLVWGVPIDKIPSSNRFDVITMWDVFEHIKDGVLYLSYLRTKLADRGIIFMQIPNSDSMAARVMREKCNVFDGIEHVNLYSSKTLMKIATKSGFEILSMGSVIDEIGPLKNYLNYDDPYSGSFSENESYDFISSEVLHKNMLGYKLQVVLAPV